MLAIPVSGLLIGSVDWSRRLALPIVSAFITGTVGVVILAPHVAKVAPIAGLEDLRPLLPEAAANAMDSSRALVLVGDAQAFKYQRPMSQLRYRTVFDVDAKPGETVIDAWSVGAPRDAILLVDPSELRRFARTYANIPMLQSNADEPFTIERAMQP